MFPVPNSGANSGNYREICGKFRLKRVLLRILAYMLDTPIRDW
jgi:hypothetical protein